MFWICLVAAEPLPGFPAIYADAFASAASVTVEQPAGADAVFVGTEQSGGNLAIDVAADAAGNSIDIARPVSHAISPARTHARLRRIGRAGSGAAGLTSNFGLRLHPVYGGMRFHSGIDLAGRSGAPIFSSSEGVVGTAGWSRGYGLLVTLNHARGLETRYGHLLRLNVTPGQRIRQGDIIGFVGSTGVSTGPHLHYELRLNGIAVDPLQHRPKR